MLFIKVKGELTIKWSKLLFNKDLIQKKFMCNYYKTKIVFC